MSDPARDWAEYLARKQTYSDPAKQTIADTLRGIAQQIPYDEFIEFTDEIHRDIDSALTFARRRASLDADAKGIGRKGK